MFDALTKLFEGKNINRKMILRNQLKNVKIQNSETIQSYFTRVAQIKEQLEVVEENVEEGEIVMTTLNGLPRSWDSLIQWIFARRRSISFNKLREECAQEEDRLVIREENMGETEDQALTVQGQGEIQEEGEEGELSSQQEEGQETKEDQKRSIQCLML